MAFLRVEKKKSGTYLRIVEPYRQDGKVRQRTLYNLGKQEDYSPEMLKRLGRKFYELGGGDVRELLGAGLSELGRYNYGYVRIVSRLLGHYGLDKLLKRIQQRHKLKFDLFNAVLLMLIERLSSPSSKRANFLHQDDYLGLSNVALHQLYRSLDKLDAYSRTVQQLIYAKGRTLFNQELDLVFYDVTTFYFDSSVEEAGALRQIGFSKDGKLGKTQVVFGMLVDQHRSPIGYHLFEGNTYEGHTLETALRQLKDQYEIGKVIVVADRAMLSKANQELIESKDIDFEFIMGEKLRKLPQSLIEKFTNLDNYQQKWIVNSEQGGEGQGDEEQKESIKIRFMLGKHKGRTLISTYSEKRAKKDRYDRQKRIAKAEQLLKHPSKLRKKVSRYFIRNKQTEAYELDQARIEAEARFDGFATIATNAQIDPLEALSRYHDLYKIEHTFRTFKSHLEARPMFHWTDKRIRGHICLCYIAYALMHQLQRRLAAKNKPLSEEELRRTLDHMQLSLVEQQGQQFYLRSSPKAIEATIWQSLGLKPVPDLIDKSLITKYL